MEIQFKKSAVKQIMNFNPDMKKRVKKAIDKLPMGDIKKLKGYKDMYRLRIGDYRIIYQLSDNSVIIIIAILPRGNAYDNL